MPENEKKQDAIAQSTRVRLARNYADVPFPGRMSPEQEEQIITRTENALQGERHTLRRMRSPPSWPPRTAVRCCCLKRAALR